MINIEVSNFNRQITLTSYTDTQDAYGGLSTSIAEQFTCWAQVIQKGGGDSIIQSQDKNYADYQIIFRYRSQITENWLISYEGLTLKIKQLQVDDPAYKRFWIVTCTVSIQQESWS